jgi:hypothetical protein
MKKKKKSTKQVAFEEEGEGAATNGGESSIQGINESYLNAFIADSPYLLL